MTNRSRRRLWYAGLVMCSSFWLFSVIAIAAEWKPVVLDIYNLCIFTYCIMKLAQLQPLMKSCGEWADKESK